ncbi:MAG: DNA repair protein RecO [Gemmatimonadota bacterium]|nr:DNA repair protein RecO [Gemmatimonadota bacterium]
MLVTTRAVILQTYRYSDTSKILRFMTLEHGPCSAVARGALRPKSRFGGMLEPFVEGDATLYMKEGRELHTLSAFELVKERRDLGHSLDLFTVASVLCELVMRLAPEHRDDQLYRTLLGGLDSLHARAVEGGSSGGLEHVWSLVSTLGFHPQLEACVSCGRPIGAERARFDFSAGGLHCSTCAPGGPGLEPAELATLRSLAAGQAASPTHGRQGRWLADFIRYHMSEGANLRSLPFLRELA